MVDRSRMRPCNGESTGEYVQRVFKFVLPDKITSHFSRAYVSNVAIPGVGCSLSPDSGTPKLPVEPLKWESSD